MTATINHAGMQADDTPARRRHREAAGRYTFGVVRLLLAAALLLVAAFPGHAADDVLAVTLDNGLRVLLLEDHRSPVAAFQIWYRVGSRDEVRGGTGLAH